MPFSYGISNHCAFILDIPIESLVGVNPVKIICPAVRCLNSKLPRCSQSYIESLEENIKHHCLLTCLYDTRTGNYSIDRARRVTIIDDEGKTYMLCAEKIYRKIKCCHIPFSPEARSGYGKFKCITFSRIPQEKLKIEGIRNVRQGDAISLIHFN